MMLWGMLLVINPFLCTDTNKTSNSTNIKINVTYSHQLSTVHLFGITSIRLTREWEWIKNCPYIVLKKNSLQRRITFYRKIKRVKKRILYSIQLQNWVKMVNFYWALCHFILLGFVMFTLTTLHKYISQKVRITFQC